MLGYRQPGAGDYKRGRRGDIERLRATRSRAGRVDETCVMRVDADGAGAHAFSQTGEFLDRLAFQFQSDQRARDLGVGRSGVEQGVEQQYRLRARKVVTA